VLTLWDLLGRVLPALVGAKPRAQGRLGDAELARGARDRRNGEVVERRPVRRRPARPAAPVEHAEDQATLFASGPAKAPARNGRARSRAAAPAQAPALAAASRPSSARVSKPRENGEASASESMQEKYDRVAKHMLEKYGIRVRKWRSGTSGVAWMLTYRDGSVKRLIEAPRPRGPMSAAVFLHEIGHHAIGFNVYKPRCLEEYHAWKFAIEAMEEHGLNVTEQVHRRMKRSLKYAVDKARRRGLRELPVELVPYAG
jgi:hypothetical protein